jgi:hypothetical protein
LHLQEAIASALPADGPEVDLGRIVVLANVDVIAATGEAHATGPAGR